jgi:hypothetical protein
MYRSLNHYQQQILPKIAENKKKSFMQKGDNDKIQTPREKNE